MDTLISYDELPYDSLPLPETQPDFLAAVAALHGFDAPDPARARILELGCAQGGNLIPLAWRWPGCACVGVELSRVQAQAGADFVARLGLANLRILHGDLAALPADLGEFDYIIAHGVYSWIPPQVQQALLDVCRRHLSANGLAYVSFNVAAGWQKLLPLRETLIAHTDAATPAPERLRQARGVLNELEAESDDPTLKKEIAYLKTALPSYLFHEYLADCNVPMRFTDFAGRLENHGLRYVGEAGPRRAVVELEDAWGLAPESLQDRWLDAESALDDALDTRFRRALIARIEAPCAQPPQLEALEGLMFYADLTSDEEIDLDSDAAQRFVNPARNGYEIAEPAMKAAVMALSSVYPQALKHAELRSAARETLQAFGNSGEIDDVAFSDALFHLVTAHGVMPTLWRGPQATEPGERPRAHALARAQAGTPGWVVSGARHVAMDLDEHGRALLAALDGTRSLDELAAFMQARLTDAGVSLPAAQVRELTHRQLWLFARQGLLD